MSVSQLMSLVYIVLFAAEAVIAWMYSSNIYSSKKNDKFVLASFFVGYTILYCAAHLWTVAINVVLFCIINCLLIKLCLKCNIKAAVFHALVLTIIMSAAESVVNLLITSITGDYNSYTYNFSAFIILIVFSKLLYFFIAIISSKLFVSHLERRDDSSNVLLLCVVPLVSMVILTTFALIGIHGQLTKITELLMSTSALALLLANIGIIYIYNRIQMLNRENTVLELSVMRDRANTAYYELLQQQYDDQRILIHNIKNHLNVIAISAEEENISGIINYVSEVQNVPELNLRTRLCQNPILNIILLDYMEECVAKGIRFDVDIRAGQFEFMDESCITALFGNLLSNAVESAQESNEKYVNVSLSFKQDQRYIFISVVNSCNTPPVTDGNGRLKSNKKNAYMHGYGTKSIERVVEKYGGTSKLYYDSVNKEFHADILFPL